jgi:hypothetical protein
MPEMKNLFFPVHAESCPGRVIPGTAFLFVRDSLFVQRGVNCTSCGSCVQTVEHKRCYVVWFYKIDFLEITFRGLKL